MRLLLLLLLTLTTPLFAADWNELRDAVKAEMQDKKLPGCAIAVIADNEVVFAEGFGLADVQAKKPVTLETRFRIGSVVKLLTAAAVLSTDIDLDEPIGRHLKDLPPRIGALTFAQLLSHRGGVGDRIREDLPLDEEVLFTEPDRIFSYSSLGFSLAARAAAANEGIAFEELLAREVLTKLAMNATSYDAAASDATGYRGKKRVEYMKADQLRPAGFLFSNVSDLSRFAIAWMNGAFSPELAKVRSDVPGDPRKYGYGTMLLEENGEPVVFHAGDEHGGSAFLKMILAKRAAVIVTANANGRLTRSMAVALRLAANHVSADETQEEGAKLTASDVADLTGHYQNWSRLRISKKGNSAILSPDLPWFLSWLPLKRELVKFAPDRFGILGTTLGPEPVRFTAVRGEDGKIAYLFIQGRAFRKK